MVLDDAIESVSATKTALSILTAVGAGTDVESASASLHIRAGRGKMRNRRYVISKGPLVIHANDYGISRAFRNLPGVDIAKVEAVNLIKLAPGGHLGRFLIWTKSAIECLDTIFGSFEIPSRVKKGYVLPRTCMKNSNLARLINSDEVQSVVNAPKNIHRTKRLPLKGDVFKKGVMFKSNTIIMSQIKNRKVCKFC